jgi:hypothetical protein
VGKDQTVPYGTDLRLNLFQARNCLATIIESLRDARGHHSTTPSLRVAGSEDEDENEARCEHLGSNHAGDIRRPGFTSVALGSHAVIVACSRIEKSIRAGVLIGRVRGQWLKIYAIG